MQTNVLRQHAIDLPIQLPDCLLELLNCLTQPRQTDTPIHRRPHPHLLLRIGTDMNSLASAINGRLQDIQGIGTTRLEMDMPHCNPTLTSRSALAWHCLRATLIVAHRWSIRTPLCGVFATALSPLDSLVTTAGACSPPGNRVSLILSCSRR
jgi:hypothetical protein